MALASHTFIKLATASGADFRALKLVPSREKRKKSETANKQQKGNT